MVVKVTEYHIHDGSDSTALPPPTVPQKVSDQKSDSKSNQTPGSSTQKILKEGKKPKKVTDEKDTKSERTSTTDSSTEHKNEKEN